MKWNDILNHSRGRQSALTFYGGEVRRLTSAATQFDWSYA